MSNQETRDIWYMLQSAYCAIKLHMIIINYPQITLIICVYTMSLAFTREFEPDCLRFTNKHP